MNYKFTITLSIITSCLYSQILWNEPPDTIWYGNQSRWVEVILPQPTPLNATIINYNEVKLTFDTYWTQEFINAYIDKFGYVPIPNRYSFYRSGVALTGVSVSVSEYIDTTTIYGETYSYTYLASDTNYQNINIEGLQHWSPRSNPTNITVKSSLSYPNNFIGVYMPDISNILLSWDLVSGADSYQIFKIFIDPNTHKRQYLTLNIGNVNEYSDVKLFPNLTYFYQILSVGGGNKSNRSNTIMVTSGTLRITNERIGNEFMLKQNIPNPFNPSTEIEYLIPFDSFVTITIYDLMGNEVKTLLNKFQTTGNHSINWDGTNNFGSTVVGGIYFYKLQADDFIQTRKMVLLK